MDIDLDLGRSGRAEANTKAELWAAAERKYRAMKRLKLAEIHERIADENRERAARLFASLGGGS